MNNNARINIRQAQADPSLLEQMEAFQQRFMQQQQDMIRKLEQSQQAVQQQRLQQPFAPYLAPHQQAQPVYRYQ
jgi:hypothetical protein